MCSPSPTSTMRCLVTPPSSRASGGSVSFQCDTAPFRYRTSQHSRRGGSLGALCRTLTARSSSATRSSRRCRRSWSCSSCGAGPIRCLATNFSYSRSRQYAPTTLSQAAKASNAVSRHGPRQCLPRYWRHWQRFLLRSLELATIASAPHSGHFAWSVICRTLV